MSPELISKLAVGLRDESRVKMKMNGQRLTFTESLLAVIVDQLNMILWQRSGKKSGKPKSLYKQFSEPPKPKDELATFNTSDDFDTWYRERHKE